MFDLFIIDSNNWKNQSNLLYGYRYLNDNGVWLELINDNEKLIFKSSIIAPCYFYYIHNDYWVISNCFNYIEKYLLDKNITLTKNNNFYINNIIESAKLIGANIYDESTMYEEIRLVPIFHNIHIINNKLNIINDFNNFAKVDIENTKNDIINWYNDYKNYINEIINTNESVADVSGGIDCRLLYSMWRENLPTRIHSLWHKKSQKEKWTYIDGLVARCILNDKQKAIIYENDTDVDPKTIDYDNNEKLFSYGNCIFPKLLEVYIPNTEKCYIINGIGTGIFKPEEFNNIKHVSGLYRRFYIQRSLAMYYLYNIIQICPYIQDKRLFSITSNQPHYLFLPLFFIYCKDLLNTPFCHGRLYKMNISELNWCKELLRKWDFENE